MQYNCTWVVHALSVFRLKSIDIKSVLAVLNGAQCIRTTLTVCIWNENKGTFQIHNTLVIRIVCDVNTKGEVTLTAMQYSSAHE